MNEKEFVEHLKMFDTDQLIQAKNVFIDILSDNPSEKAQIRLDCKTTLGDFTEKQVKQKIKTQLKLINQVLENK